MKPEEPQLRERFRFRPQHDHLLRALFMIFAFFALIGAAVSYWYWQRPAWQEIGIAPEQPVPFSHKHHVSDVGIDCRYCHTGVQTSSFAGVPPTETCMTCHSQIWSNAPVLQPVRDSSRESHPLQWRQVTSLPNYVYFNHSVHVNRGVACVTCHGRVDQMAITSQAIELKMAWCLDCHRAPEKHFVPLSQVTWPEPTGGPLAGNPPPLTAVEKARLTNCTVCHR